MLAVNWAAKRKNLQGIEFGYILKKREEEEVGGSGIEAFGGEGGPGGTGGDWHTCA